MAQSLNLSGYTPLDRLSALIETLRGENGCPWDREQTPSTVTRYLIEEVYELVDAVLSGDPDAVCDEAGDVLFQVLFVTHLFSESGHFCIQDVIDKNIQKMVRRHPHVFGDVTAKTAEKVSENWDRIKRSEKSGKEQPSLLDSIPKGLPALARAAMASERAAKTGFDWDDISGVMAKAMEEWEEFSTELGAADGAGGSDRASMEFGDVLFTMVNVARFARIHPETALIRSIQKFEARFRHMEAKATEAGRDISDLSFEEMHALWDEAKRKLF